MAEDSDGVHVGSGSFRVDRARALEVLMRFQLPSAERFLLPLIRCAVLSKATFVRITGSSGLLELAFDGQPLARARLADPYSGLFEEEDAASPLGRDLAVGILTALRQRPKSVEVFSGWGANRVLLTVKSLEEDRIAPCDDEGKDTVIRVSRSLTGPPVWGEKHASALRTACFACPIPVRIGERALERRQSPAEPPGIFFQQGGVYGWLTVPGESASLSGLEGICRGVYVDTVHVALPRIQVAGYVNDDEFSMNAAQTSIVEDARFQTTMTRVGLQAERLMKEMVLRQGALLSEAGKALKDPRLLARWKGWLEGQEDASRTVLLEGDGARQLRWCARVTSWLREASIRLLKDSEKDAAHPTLSSLWEAPLWLSVAGRPLSLRQLEEQRRRLGYVPVSKEPSQAPDLPLEAVWLASSKDVAGLSPRFPGAVRDVTDRLNELKAYGPFRLGQAPNLDRTGAAEILARAPLASGGNYSGEVGLSLLPHEAGARLHVFGEGGPPKIFEVPSALRFDAALSEDPGPLEPGRGFFSELQKSTRGLYKKLAKEYSCHMASERNQAVREHLLDFLLWRCGQVEGVGDPDEWIETEQVFDCLTHWLNFRELRRELAEGKAVYMAPSRIFAASLTNKLVLIGWRYTDSFLARVFPGAETAPVPGMTGVRVIGLRKSSL